MIYYKLLLSITSIALFLVQADAKPSMLMNVENLGFAGDSLDDPLNPANWANPCPCPRPKTSFRRPGRRE